jgi:hypothetical protein
MYENFFRLQASTATGVAKDDNAVESAEENKTSKKKKKTVKRKSRRRTRSKVRRRKPRKNSIFNRTVQGCSKDHSR